MAAKHQVDAIRDAQRGKVSTRVAGHQMTGAGKVITGPSGYSTGRHVGSTFCSCGEESPEFDNDTKRKQWHRAHKLDVLAQAEKKES